MHQSSFYLMQRYAARVRDQFLNRPVKVLDVGSMNVNGCYKEMFAFPGATYVGMDIAPGPNVDIVPADPYEWKELPDDDFDVIVSGQALEHVEFPWLVVAQMARKLKVGGHAFLIVPSRGPQHRYPVDCYRYYPDGLRALAKWSGLEVLEVDVMDGGSGFHDGSDQWGDCHCLMVKQAAVEQRPETPAPQRQSARSFHSRNPVRLAKNQPYYKFARTEVVNALVQKEIPARRVIELGCASGETGKAIKQGLKTEFYAGIELVEEVAEQARTKLDQVYVADIETTSPAQLGLKDGDFDLLVALDVLEHLQNPWDVLAELVRLLKPGGHAVLSIPNIQNIKILTDLIQGKWTYTGAGILDATHLRFFTLESMRDLLEGAGLTLIDTRATLENQQVDLNKVKEEGNIYEDSNWTLTGLSKEDVIRLYAYQYILLGRR